MGIWKEIKYALNSTLGTKEFKPLNNLILDNRIFVAHPDFSVLSVSDETFDYIYVNAPGGQNNLPITIGSFKTEISGALYLNFESVSNQSGTYTLQITLTDNDGNIQTFSFESQYRVNTSHSFLINVNSSKTYTITLNKISDSTMQGTVSNFSLKGIAVLGSHIQKV